MPPGLTRRRDSSRYTETAREWTQKFAVRGRAPPARPLALCALKKQAQLRLQTLHTSHARTQRRTHPQM
jgi:hypothetical protein